MTPPIHGHLQVYYIYGWFLNGVCLYIGKGTSTRYISSEGARRSLTMAGLSPNNPNFQKRILLYNLTHHEALEVEDAVIRHIGRRWNQSGTLCNRFGGWSKYQNTTIHNLFERFPHVRVLRQTEPNANVIKHIKSIKGLT